MEKAQSAVAASAVPPRNDGLGGLALIFIVLAMKNEKFF
jgi:hypothetical protein